MGETTRRQTPSAPTPADADTIVDIDALRLLCGLKGESGHDLAGDLIELFAANTANALVRLRELSDRAPEGAAEAEHLAHTLKGSAASVGATGLAALAQHAEALAGRGECGELAAIVSRLTDALAPTTARLREARLVVLRER